MKLRILLVAVVMAVISTGCLRAEIDIEVRDDDSVSISGLFAADPEAIAQINELFGEDLGGEVPSREELCEQFTAEQGLDDMDSSTGIDVTTEPYDEDGFCGVRFSGEATPEEAPQLLATLSEGDGGVLRREGEGWYFELPLAEQAADAGEFTDFPGLDGVFDGASYVVRVKLPGRQVEHNADGITSDGTLVWDLDLLAPPERIFVRTEPGEPITGDFDGGGSEGGSGGSDDDGGLSTGLLIGIIAAVVILGGLVFVLLRRRGKGDAAAPVSTATPPGGAWAPPSAGPAAGTPASQGGWNPPGGVGTAVAAPPSQAPDPTQPQPIVGQPPVTQQQPVVDAAPSSAPTPAQSEPTPSPQPAVIASPTPEQATGTSVWDPVRRAYVQWDPGAGRWLVFDDAAGQWRHEG